MSGTVQACRSGRASPWTAVCLKDPCVERLLDCFVFFFFNLSPVKCQEPFLVGISFLWVHKRYLDGLILPIG